MPPAARAVLERLKRRENLVLGVVLGIWAAITIVTVVHHEPWRDEAETWLNARDASLVELWGLMRYVGSPILPYLVQVPVAKLGAPFAAQEMVHWPMALGIAAIILFR